MRGRSQNLLLGFSFRSFRASPSAFAFKKDKATMFFLKFPCPLLAISDRGYCDAHVRFQGKAEITPDDECGARVAALRVNEVA
jgi:hypothetical protein